MRRLKSLILLSTVLLWLIFPLDLPADEVSSSTLSLHSPDYPPRTPIVGAELIPAYRASPIPPSLASDIASSPEAPVTGEIIAKAEELKRNAVYIYQYVKDSLELEFYYGSMKGAVETMKQGGGNDADLSSLLVALFRAIEVPARYVRGKIELPMEEVMNLIGVEKPELVMLALTRAGIPFEPVYRGGKLSAIRKEHIWVEIYIPYLPHRGAILDPRLKKEWIPLDPSIKKGYEYTSPPDILAEMGFDARAVNLEYLSSLRTEAPLEFYRSIVSDYLASNHPDLSYEDVLRKRTLIPEVLGLLPNALLYRVVSVIGEYASLPEELRHKIRFLAKDGSGDVLLDGTLDLPEILGKRLTLSYIGATAEDRATISLYGGNYNTPGYLAEVKPVVKVDGIDRIEGENEVGLGRKHELILEFITPAGTTRVDKSPIAGNYFAIGLGAPGITWVEPKERVEEDTDGLALIMLYDRARDYLNQVVEAERELTSLAGVINVIPTVREVMVYNEVNVNYLSDLPVGMEWKGVSVDAALRTSSPIPIRQAATGDKDLVSRNYLLLSGFQGSWLENRVLEEGFSAESISAVKAIQIAGDQGLEILNIDSDNLAEQLPKLSAPEEVVNDIKNAVNRKLTVKIPASEFTYQAWNGIGYIKENPATGEAGYELSGKISGGMTVLYYALWLIDYREILKNPELLREPSTGPVAELKITGGNWQTKKVGEEFNDPLEVQVLDNEGRPVKFAEVTYCISAGRGSLAGIPGSTKFDSEGKPIGCKNGSRLEGQDSITICTGAAGIAAVTLTSGTNTYLNPIYARTDIGEAYPSQALYNLVAVTAGSAGEIRDNFVAIGMPGEAEELVKIHGDKEGVEVMSFSGYISINVVDEYENPVSNKEVTFLVLEPAASPDNFKNALIFWFGEDEGECNIDYPLWGECGGPGPLMPISSHKGASVQTIVGNKDDFDYRFRASSQIKGAEKEAIFIQHTNPVPGSGGEEPAPPQLVVQTTVPVDEWGRVIQGAAVGTKLKEPLKATLYEIIEEDKDGDGVGDGTFSSTKVANGNVIFSPYGTPLASVTSPTNIGNGEYTTMVTLGKEPGVNWVGIQGIKGDLVSGKIYYYAFGVKIEGPEITPQPLLVDESGQSQADLVITFEILPPEYVAYESQLDRYKGSTIFSSQPVAKGGEGRLTIVEGAYFDIASPYSVQLVLNRGSAQEVKGEEKKIDLASIFVEQEDPFYPEAKLRWNDYYPALGDKRIVVRGKSTEGKPLEGVNITSQLISPQIPQVAISPAQVSMTEGKAEFTLSGGGLVPPLEGEEPAGTIQEEIELSFGVVPSEGVPCGDLTRAIFAVKSNSNVTVGEVLEGEAVFLYDDPSLDTVNNWEYHQGYTPVSVTDPLQKKVDFLQEVINQVLPRKRDVENYELIEEKGYYLEDTEEALAIFKDKFKHEINTNVDYTLVDDDDIVYGDADTTTVTFRKLMKDYNKVESPEEVEEWLDKVVDKETLVGETETILDNQVNDPANDMTDTGLYELYENVVVNFINEMIGEVEGYKNYSGVNWIARTGESGANRGNGVSYSFGSKQTVGQFGGDVSTRGACEPNVVDNHPTCQVTYQQNGCDPVDANYAGNIDDTTGQLNGSKKYPGLLKNEYKLWHDLWRNGVDVPDCSGDNRFDPVYWAGVDCSGLVQRGMNTAEFVSGIPGLDTEVGNLSLGLNRAIASGDFFTDARSYFMSVAGLTDDQIKEVASKFHKGDLVSYSGHISIIYTDPDWRGNYEIVHANGSKCTEYEADDSCRSEKFARKVLVTNYTFEDFPDPVGFGKIKLWD